MTTARVLTDSPLSKSPSLPMDYNNGVLNSMCTPFFPELREELGPYLVDKTQLIENIVVKKRLKSHADLVLRPRRCGKSTMLQMLKSFFSIPRNDDPDPRLLFKGLYIASRQDICTEHMGKYPVIFCDFKDLTGRSWEEMLWNFKDLVSVLYKKWKNCLMESLQLDDKAYFESICLKTATTVEFTTSLSKLSCFLFEKFGRKVIVLIDEYEAPNNRAFKYGYSEEANELFGHEVLSPLLKSNESLQYAVLAGITPAAKSGWYSALNNLEVHALHTKGSVFAGMLLFTQREVKQLKELSRSELELQDLKVHYNSYIAGGHIGVYNPVSVMSAFKTSSIENYWVATGEYPLLNREFPPNCIDVVEDLLAGAEITFTLEGSVTYSNVTLSKDETLTLLYYAGYLTMTINGRFKIPNREVMTDWARWIIGDVGSCNNILETCVEGPISDFEVKWPNFMQQFLDPRIVSKTRGAISRKTPEKIYQVLLLGLMEFLRAKGWEVIIEARAGGGYVDLRLLHKQGCKAVLIELKSSGNERHLERDANRALEQIVEKNYRNPEGLRNILTLREYGIACFHLNSCVKGRYLKRNSEADQWVEQDDVRGRGALSQGCRAESSGKSRKRKIDGTGAGGGRARKR